MADESGNLPLRLTPYYASLLDAADPLQPLRRSVVPVTAEQLISCGEADDPLGEDTHSRVPGLVHRYPDRVLFLVTDFCSTYCRYCTRSRLVGDQNKRHLNREQWDRALSYIETNPDIRDVLLSGGDPLTLPDDSLDWLLTRLRRIPHVEFVRIGTKVPVVLPQRITHALVNLLKRYHPLWMSLHFTHPDEITPETAQACERLADAGIPLGSQTVLLKGVNDSVPVMKKLMHGLLDDARPSLLPVPVRPHPRLVALPHAGGEGPGDHRGPARPHQRLRGPALRDRRPGRRRQDPAAARLLPGARGRRRAAAQLSEEHLPLSRTPRRRRGAGRGLAATPRPLRAACISAAVGIKSPAQRNGDKPMTIGLTYDLRHDYLAAGYSQEETAEFDRVDTIEGIESALQALGHETERIGNVKSLVGRLAAGERWDMVFNICEGMFGMGREAQVPALLDAYEIPYTFSDPLILALTLDKGMTKTVVRSVGVPTPDFAVVAAPEDVAAVDLPFPLFAKPVAEGTGKGIDARSKVDSPQQLAAVCRELLAKFSQPVLVETYLPGREFTVGIVGSGATPRSSASWRSC